MLLDSSSEEVIIEETHHSSAFIGFSDRIRVRRAIIIRFCFQRDDCREDLREIVANRFHHRNAREAEDESENFVAFLVGTNAVEDGLLHARNDGLANCHSSITELSVRRDTVECFIIRGGFRAKCSIVELAQSARDV